MVDDSELSLVEFVARLDEESDVLPSPLVLSDRGPSDSCEGDDDDAEVGEASPVFLCSLSCFANFLSNLLANANSMSRFFSSNVRLTSSIEVLVRSAISSSSFVVGDFFGRPRNDPSTSSTNRTVLDPPEEEEEEELLPPEWLRIEAGVLATKLCDDGELSDVVVATSDASDSEFVVTLRSSISSLRISSNSSM